MDEVKHVVLHVSPHPDDEVIAAGATLSLLHDAGIRVINLVCGLGRPTQRPRRLAELREATRRAGHELVICDPVVELSASDDLQLAEDQLTVYIASLLNRAQVDLVIGPHEHDGHHAHETVARAIRRSPDSISWPLTWWAWGLWADLSSPTLYVPFDELRLKRVEHVLVAYTGENDRNNYRRLVRGRAMANSVLGSERIFGFGSSAASPMPYAELFEEQIFDGDWTRGPVRVLSLVSDQDSGRVS